jgi:site-specific DNA recombinase
MTAGGYFRTSTTNQKDEQTIESQIAEVKARVEADGNVLPEENMFSDDGWTGEILQRPALDLMRDAAIDGKFEALYVYDRGRLSRIFAYQEIILEELADKGVKFVTLHDVAAETPEEKVLQAMQGVFAQYERVKIAERFRRGKLYKAKNGVLINGQAPYGYTHISRQEKKPADIIINEEEAEVVKKIFYWVGIERISIREVKKRLMVMGIRPRKGKKEVWTNGPICRLLRNRVYENGIVFYNKTEAIVAKNPRSATKYRKIKRTSRKARPREEWLPFQAPVILEDSWLFEKVQQILTLNKSFAGKNRKYDYLLSGLVFCECGSKRAGDGETNGHHYYRCAERLYKFPLESKCKVQGVNAAVLDGLTWFNLKRFLSDKDTLHEQAEKWLRSQVGQDGIVRAESDKLVRLLENTKEEELRYAKVYGTGNLDLEQFQELSKELKQRKLSYNVQIKELSAKSAEASIISPDETDRLCKTAELVLSDMVVNDKKKIIHDIIDKLVIYDSGEVEVKGHMPEFSQTNQKLGLYNGYRNCGVAKCGEVNIV